MITLHPSHCSVIMMGVINCDVSHVTMIKITLHRIKSRLVLNAASKPVQKDFARRNTRSVASSLSVPKIRFSDMTVLT
jgi:hypothetical protein